MQIVTIIEDNPITGVRYGTVQMPESYSDKKRTFERYYKLRKQFRHVQRMNHTKHR